VAAAADQLLLALSLAPGRCEILANQAGIDAQERAADVLRERKGLVPVGFKIVVKDAADAALVVPVLKIEIFATPFPAFVMRFDFPVRVAGGYHGSMNGDAVGIVVNASLVKQGREIGAAAKPSFAGDDEASVHVNCRDVRIVQMRDQ